MSGSFSDMILPQVTNVPPKTLAEDLVSMNASEVRDAMENMFKNFEKRTGVEVGMEGGDSPIQVFNPKKKKNDG